MRSERSQSQKIARRVISTHETSRIGTSIDTKELSGFAQSWGLGEMWFSVRWLGTAGTTTRVPRGPAFHYRGLPQGHALSTHTAIHCAGASYYWGEGCLPGWLGVRCSEMNEVQPALGVSKRRNQCPLLNHLGGSRSKGFFASVT